MNTVNRVVLKLEKYEKCEMVCDLDCPLGQLYDYSCVLQSFVLSRMAEAEAQKKAQEQVDAPKE